MVAWHKSKGVLCSECGCGTFSDSPVFEPDGSRDKTTRRISVNARLFDNFDAAYASVEVNDGKNIWQQDVYSSKSPVTAAFATRT